MKNDLVSKHLKEDSLLCMLLQNKLVISIFTDSSFKEADVRAASWSALNNTRSDRYHSILTSLQQLVLHFLFGGFLLVFL